MKKSQGSGCEKGKLNRREFFVKSAGLSAGLALMTVPGISAGKLTGEEKRSKEVVLKELNEKVMQFMPKYRSCSMTSFAVLNDYFKLNGDMRTIRALMPFSGGIVRRGETCGAVSGSMLALGLFFENRETEGKTQSGASLKPGTMFFDRFEKVFGSTRCKGVIKHQFGRYYDLQNPEEVKLFMEEGKKGQCMQVVQKAVTIAGEIILEHS